MVRRLSVVFFVTLLPLAFAGADELHPEFGESDADITTTEDIHGHEGRTGGIDSHEGHTETMQGREAKEEGVDPLVTHTEEIDRHESATGSMAGRETTSEALEGEGHGEVTPAQRLRAAEARLEAARARHARVEPHEPAEALPAAPAASPAGDEPWAKWTARLDVAQKRIQVARAALEVWDQSYADMMRDDYPRGEARQQLIDSRERAKDRLAAEEAKLPKLVEAARRDGVPPGVLEVYSSGGAGD